MPDPLCLLNGKILDQMLIQLSSGLLGICFNDGQRAAEIIPEGAIVQVFVGALQHSKMVEVRWEGRTLAVSIEDLSERGKRIE